MNSWTDHRILLFSTVSALAMVFMPSEADAQGPNQTASPSSARPLDMRPSAESNDGPIGDIVVTARRRVEKLQDVPQAVSVMTQSELRSQLVTNQNDLQSKIPSLSVAGRYGSTGGTYAIRGLSSSNSGTASVGTYFAEVPTPTNNLGYDSSAGQSLYDLDSVQVLKGPQGTLFGRSTTAGAVLVTPAAPDLHDVKAHGNLALGNLGYIQATLAVSVPLIDNVLAIRVAGNYNHRLGYTKVIGTGQRLNGLNNESQRVSVRFQPTSWFKSTTIYDRFHVDQSPSAFITSSYNPNLPLFNPATNIGPLTAICGGVFALGQTPSVAACVAQRQAILASIKANLAAEVARTAAGGDELRKINAGSSLYLIERSTHQTVVNTTEITLPELGPLNINLKNIFGYQTTNGIMALNVSGTPDDATIIYIGVGAGLSANQSGNRAQVGIGPGNKFYSNETQLSGSIFGDRIVLVGGYYYQHAPSTVDPTGVGTLQKSFGGITTVNLGWAAAAPFTVNGRTNQSAWYAQATLNLAGLIDGLHLTAGFRHTKDDFLLRTAAAVINPITGILTPSLTITTQALKTSGNNYNFSLDYKVSRNILVYLARRKGYVPGGLNNPTGLGSPNFKLQFDPERIKDVEVGLKSDFTLDGVRGRLNLAAYSAKYANIQRSFTNFVNNASVVYVANVASAKLRGIEAELSVIPMSNLTLSANYSFNETKYAQWTGADPYGVAPSGTNLDLSNNPFQNAPRHKTSLSATYGIPLAGNNGTIIFSGQYSYQSRVYYLTASNRYIQIYGPAAKEAISNKGHGVANAHIDWQDVLGHQGVTTSIFARNLFDKIYTVSANGTNQNLGHSAKVYGEPRIVGVSIAFEY